MANCRNCEYDGKCKIKKGRDEYCGYSIQKYDDEESIFDAIEDSFQRSAWKSFENGEFYW